MPFPAVGSHQMPSSKLIIFTPCQDWSWWSFRQKGSSHQHGDWRRQANPEGHWDILQHHRRGDAHECGWSYLEESTCPSSTLAPLILAVKTCFLYDLNSENFLCEIPPWLSPLHSNGRKNVAITPSLPFEIVFWPFFGRMNYWPASSACHTPWPHIGTLNSSCS